jgi:hypothetical protein
MINSIFMLDSGFTTKLSNSMTFIIINTILTVDQIEAIIVANDKGLGPDRIPKDMVSFIARTSIKEYTASSQTSRPEVTHAHLQMKYYSSNPTVTFTTPLRNQVTCHDF